MKKQGIFEFSIEKSKKLQRKTLNSCFDFEIRHKTSKKELHTF